MQNSLQNMSSESVCLFVASWRPDDCWEFALPSPNLLFIHSFLLVLT